MNIDNELNCVDLIRAVVRIQELCSNRSCKNCIFCENLCKIRYPKSWETGSLNEWLKEHESEETK